MSTLHFMHNKQIMFGEGYISCIAWKWITNHARLIRKLAHLCPIVLIGLCMITNHRLTIQYLYIFSGSYDQDHFDSYCIPYWRLNLRIAYFKWKEQEQSTKKRHLYESWQSSTKTAAVNCSQNVQNFFLLHFPNCILGVRKLLGKLQRRPLSLKLPNIFSFWIKNQNSVLYENPARTGNVLIPQ